MTPSTISADQQASTSPSCDDQHVAERITKASSEEVKQEGTRSSSRTSLLTRRSRRVEVVWCCRRRGGECKEGGCVMGAVVWAQARGAAARLSSRSLETRLGAPRLLEKALRVDFEAEEAGAGRKHGAVEG